MRKQHITEADPVDARRVLTAQRNELLRRLNKRYELQIEREHDPLDETVRQAERDQVCREISAYTALLRAVRDALQRLDAGRWGVCAECGEAIPAARLAALPWAALCVACQTDAETVTVERL